MDDIRLLVDVAQLAVSFINLLLLLAEAARKRKEAKK